jgi:hypothetical protein
LRDDWVAQHKTSDDEEVVSTDIDFDAEVLRGEPV